MVMKGELGGRRRERRGRYLWRPEHGRGGGQHYDREQCELHPTSDEHREPRAEVRADHRNDAEDERGLEIDVAGSPVADRADQAGDADDSEAHDDGLLGFVAQHVHQYRYREDGATAAEQAQGEPDERCECEAHDCHMFSG